MEGTAVASKLKNVLSVNLDIASTIFLFPSASFILEIRVFFINSVPLGNTRFTWAKQVKRESMISALVA